MISILALERAFVYLTIIAGFMGAAFLVVEAGPIHLFPYRFLLPFLWMLFVIAVLGNKGRVKISHIKVRIYLQFLGFWLLYAVLSLSWAASKETAIRDITCLFMAVSVIFFTIYYFNDLRCLKWFYNLWLLVFAALIPLGIWEIVTGRHLVVSALAQIVKPQTRFMPTAIFHNPNDYATFLALALPFVLTWIRYCGGLTKRLFGMLALVVGLYLLIATASRSNYLAVLVEGVFWFIFLLKPKHKIKTLILVGLFMLALFAAFPNRVQNVFTTIGVQLDILGDYLSQVDSSSISVRLTLIKNALIFLIKSLGFGVGAGNIEYHMANFAVYYTYEKVNVHNWWVEILANYGILIFVGYVVFYLSLLFVLYKAYGKLQSTGEKMLGEAILVALVGFSFASISSSSIMALGAHWLLFAFALAFLNYLKIKRVVV